MTNQAYTYPLSTSDGRLTVHTGRSGAASKAGHDLEIEVSHWEAMMTLSEEPGASSVALTADATSLRVIDGTGGVTKLGEDDKADIKKTIDDKVLKRSAIRFISSNVSTRGDGKLTVQGHLELLGKRSPVSFDLSLKDGRLKGTAQLKQSSWGITPYSALFGALKVADEVRIAVDAQLPSPQRGQVDGSPA